MSDLYQHVPSSNTLDNTLVKMARIIQALGVEEFRVSSNSHEHVINTGTLVDKLAVDCFVSQINEMYISIVVPGQGGGPISKGL